MTSEIRTIARDLFGAGKIGMLVGFEKGSVGHRAKPSFFSSAADVERLVWDSTCSNNLAVYLPGLFQRPPARKGVQPAPLPRIGFVVKACDMRSIVALVKEKQAPRENLVLIGVPCRGMVDARKVDKAADGADVTALEDGTNTVTLTTADGRTLGFPRETLVQDACLSCRSPKPEGADVTVTGESRAPADDGDSIVTRFAALSATERWKSFQAELSRCIRCYACRQACPTCYCKECFAETNAPAWIGVSNELTDVMIFHLIRIFHQAGRCVECDACSRACPVGIDLRTFTKKIAVDVRTLFGFTPDFSLETAPPLTTFKEDDAQEFITEPGSPGGAAGHEKG